MRSTNFGQILSQKSLRFVYNKSQRPTINTTIDLEDVSDKEEDEKKEAFQPRGICVSNNDFYVAVVGQKETWVIDTRKGEIVYKQDLPKDSKNEARKRKYRHTILGS